MKRLFKSIASVALMLCIVLLANTSCDIDLDIFGPIRPEIDDNRGIILNKTELDLTQGSTYALSARLSVGEGDFVWSSSNEDMAVVSENGYVTCVGIGEVVITASCGNKSASCTINVTLPPYMPVFTDEEQVLTLVKGQNFDIDDTVTFDGKTVDARVMFESENTDIATVNEKGQVMGVDSGETYIKVTADYCGLITAMKVKVTVNTDIVIESSGTDVRLATLTIPNTDNISSKELSFIVLNKGSDISDTLSVEWTIDDERVVSLSGSGTHVSITANAIGEARAVATFVYEEKSFSFYFNIKVEAAKHISAPRDGYVALDLSAVEGEIKALTIDGNDVMEYLSSAGILMIPKASISAGERAVEITASGNKYALVLVIDKENILISDLQIIAENGTYTVDLSSAGIDWSDVISFTINGSDGSAMRNGDIIKMPASSTPYGNYRISILTNGKRDYSLNVFCYTNRLNTTTVRSAADLLMLLSGAPNASFVLEEDLDLGGATFAGYVTEFFGTLDGQGHAIRNFKIVPTTLFNPPQGNDLNANYLIQTNSGTIKNILFDYEMKEIADCNLSALIGKNRGTVENCLVKMHFTSVRKSWNFAAFVNDNYGTVSNCVTIITKNTAAATHPGENETDESALGKHFGSVVSIARQNSTLTNCYAIYNDVLTGFDASHPYQFNGLVEGAAVENCKNFKTLEEFFAHENLFPKENGWSDDWKAVNGVVIFGSTALKSKTLADISVTPAGGFYSIDLSSVDGNIASVTLNGKTYTSFSGKTFKISKTDISEGKYALTLKDVNGISYAGNVTFAVTVTVLDDLRADGADGNYTVILPDSISNNILKVTLDGNDVTDKLSGKTLALDANVGIGIRTLKVITEGATDYTIKLIIAPAGANIAELTSINFVRTRTDAAGSIKYLEIVFNLGQAISGSAFDTEILVNGAPAKASLSLDPANKTATFTISDPKGWSQSTAASFYVVIPVGLTFQDGSVLIADSAWTVVQGAAMSTNGSWIIGACTGKSADSADKITLNAISYTRAIIVGDLNRLDIQFAINKSITSSQTIITTVLVNGEPGQAQLTIANNTATFYVINPKGWSQNGPTSFYVIIPEDLVLHDGSVIEASSAWIITQPSAMAQSGAYIRVDCKGEPANETLSHK